MLSGSPDACAHPAGSRKIEIRTGIETIAVNNIHRGGVGKALALEYKLTDGFPGAWHRVTPDIAIMMVRTATRPGVLSSETTLPGGLKTLLIIP
jgi:hypothetical protein